MTARPDRLTVVVAFDDAAYGAEVHDLRPLGVPVDAASLMTPLGAAGWSLAPRITEGTPP